MKSTLALSGLSLALLGGISLHLQAQQRRTALEEARTPPPEAQEPRAIDAFRQARQRERTWRAVSRAGGLLASDPAAALALLENPDECVPEVRDSDWLRAWRKCQRRQLEIGGRAAGVVFSADGKRLAVWNGGTAVSVRNTATGGEIASLTTRPRVSGVVLSPDGTSALVAGDQGLSFWDLNSGKNTGLKERGRPLGFLPDGKTVVIQNGETVLRWTTATGKGETPFKVEGLPANHVPVVSRDGKMLWALARDGETHALVTIDLLTGKESARTPLGDKVPKVAQALLSPDGGVLVIGTEFSSWRHGSALVFNRKGQKTAAVSLPPGPWALSPDGKLLACRSASRGIDMLALSQGSRRITLPAESVSSLAFAPDGKTLAVGDSERTVLWELEAPEEIAHFSVPLPAKHQAVLAPAGDTLAVWTPEQVQLWDLGGRAVRHTLKPAGTPAGKVTQLFFAWDGRRLATLLDNGSLDLWDVRDGKRFATIPKQASAFREVVFLPGNRGVLTYDGMLRVWDLGGQEKAKLSPSGSVKLARSGTLIALHVNNRLVKLIDPLTLKDTGKLADLTVPISLLRVAANGSRLFGTHADERVTVWDASGKKLLLLQCQTRKPQKISIASRKYWDVSADGSQLATVDTLGSIRVFDTTRGTVVYGGSTVAEFTETYQEFKGGFRHSARETNKSIWGLSFVGHTRLLSCRAGEFFGKLQQDDVLGAAAAGWNVSLSLPATRRWLDGSFDGQVLAAAVAGKEVLVWRKSTPLAQAGLPGHLGAVRGLAFSGDGRLLYSVSEDGTVREWDVASTRSLRTFEDHTTGLVALALSPDGKRLFVREAGRLLVRDLASGRRSVLVPKLGHGDTLQLSPDGQSVLLGEDTFKLFDAATGKVITTFLVAPRRDGGRCLFDASGKSVVLVAGTVRVQPVQGGQERRLKADARNLITAALRPDGKVLALLRQHTSRGTSEVVLWDIDKDVLIRSWKVPELGLRQMVFSPDGKTLVLAGVGPVSLWATARGECLANLPGHLRRLQAVAFSSDGKVLASADEGGAIRLWNVGR